MTTSSSIGPVEQRLKQRDQLVRQVCDRDHPGRNHRCRNQEHDHGGSLRCRQEHCVQLRDLEFAVDHRRDEQRIDCCDNGCLGGREDTEFQPEDHDDRHHQREGCILEGRENLRPRGTWRRLYLLLAHEPPPGQPQPAPSISPGAMPARNSLDMETFAATPKITKPIEGGMIGAMIEAEASRPAERAVS